MAPKPQEKITDYRTEWSGVRPENLIGAPNFWDVRNKVARLIQGRILVGHSLQLDLTALHLDHPREMTRDTAKFRKFRPVTQAKKTSSLKTLAERFLGVGMKIQTGEHSSVEDTQVAVKLYHLVRAEREADPTKGL